MKKVLTIAIFFILSNGYSQNTLIPDSNFEQALINLGFDSGLPDGNVPTANIDTATSLYVNLESISDLTGIEDFIELKYLYCAHNQLTLLDLSQNVKLYELFCNDNYLTTLDLQYNPNLYFVHCEQNNITNIDVSQNYDLSILFCFENDLTNLDISQNDSLWFLNCNSNFLTSLDLSSNESLRFLHCRINQLINLDLSNNPLLEFLDCQLNQLTCLNLKNGVSGVHYHLMTLNNPNLDCIEDDDVAWSTTNWAANIDSWTSFSNYCGNDCTTGLIELSNDKEIIKVIDFLGREVPQNSNTAQIYMFSDGSTMKTFQIGD